MKIMKIKLTDEQQKRVDKLLAGVDKGHSRSSDAAKNRMKEKHLAYAYGRCVTCGSIASYIAITKIPDAQIAQRYCQEHSGKK